MTERYSPIKIMDNVKYACAADDSSFAIKNDGSLWAWGHNLHGALGDGTSSDYRYSDSVGTYLYDNNDRYSPVKIMDNILQVSSSMALKSDGSLWEWGRDPLEDAVIYPPRKVMDDVLSFVGSSFYAVILKNDYTLWARGAFFSNNIPTKFLDDVVAFSGDAYAKDGDSSYINLAVLSDGSLWSWRDHNSPQKLMGGVMLPVLAQSNRDVVLSESTQKAYEEMYVSNLSTHMFSDRLMEFDLTAYALHDINSDGVPEFIGDFGDGSQYMRSVFTIKDGKPIELFLGWTHEWLRSITTDGYIITEGGEGGWYGCAIYEMSNNTHSLDYVDSIEDADASLLSRFGVDVEDSLVWKKP